MSSIVRHCSGLVLSVPRNVLSLKAKQSLKYFYIKGLCACEFEDVNERMFNAQMCHNTK